MEGKYWWWRPASKNISQRKNIGSQHSRRCSGLKIQWQFKCFHITFVFQFFAISTWGESHESLVDTFHGSVPVRSQFLYHPLHWNQGLIFNFKVDNLQHFDYVKCGSKSRTDIWPPLPGERGGERAGNLMRLFPWLTPTQRRRGRERPNIWAEGEWVSCREESARVTGSTPLPPSDGRFFDFAHTLFLLQ